MKWFSAFSVLLISQMAVVALATTGAAEANLAEYVPADAGLCLEGRGVGKALDQFAEGPMFARWKNYPPLAKWHVEQRRQIEQLSQGLKQAVGVGWDDLQGRLFGRRWLLAVFPPQPDEDGKQPFDGFFLAEVDDGELLASAADKLCALHRREGRYIGEKSIEVGDREMTVLELRTNDGGSLFLAVDGNFGCAATRFQRLVDVVNLRAAADRGNSLGASAEYRTATAKLSPDAVLLGYLRPSAWPLVHVDRAEPLSAEEKLLDDTWKALTSVAASVELGDSPRLELHVAWNKEKLPEPIRGSIGGLSGGKSPAAAIPAESLLAVAVQADLKRIVAAVMTYAENEAKQHGDRLPAEAVVAGRLVGALGPNAVAYVTTAAADDRRPLPLDWALGIDTQPVREGETSFADVLDPLVRTVMVLAADAHNADKRPTAKVETVEIDSLRITGLTGLGPSADLGVFTARVGGRLWCGGSPEALAQGARPSPDKNLAGDAMYRRVHNPRLDDARQFVYVNFQAVRRTLNSIIASPPPWLAALKSPEARSQLGELNALLSLVDAALVEAIIGDDGLHLSSAITVADE